MERRPHDYRNPDEDEYNRSQSEDEQEHQGAGRIRSRSSSTPHSSDGSILQKPVIPPILRSSSGPVQSPEDDKAKKESPIKAKRSSILKKKRQDGQGPTVSFELDSTALSRAKSSDSNLSFESETGYWSAGSGGSGILKGCKSDSESSSSDGKSILKQRRASLGNLTTDDDPDGNELHSILKRKLSYDSSVLLNSTKSSQFSLSTNSLPTDMSDVSPEPKPILKNKYNSSDEQLLDDNADEQTQHTPRPILKNGPRRNGTHGKSDEPIRPILKRSSHSVEKKYDDQSSSGGKGILKRSSSNSRRQSGGSDMLDPDDFNHESCVGFMLNPDDGLDLRFRHSDSPLRRAGSTTPRSESEEEIMLTLTEKRSILKQMDSVSVDRGSSRKRRLNKRGEARQLVHSDRNSPYRDLEQFSQKFKVESPGLESAEINSNTIFNTKGQLLSSILGQISDSHDRKQQLTTTETETINPKGEAAEPQLTEESDVALTGSKHGDRQSEIQQSNAQVSIGVENGHLENQDADQIEFLNNPGLLRTSAHVGSSQASASKEVRDGQIEIDMDELEVSTIRLSVNSVNDLKDQK